MKTGKPRLLVLTSTLPRWEKDTEPRFVLDLAKAMSDRFEPVIFAPMAARCRRSSTLEGVSVERFRYGPDSWQQLAAPGAIMPNLRAKPWMFALVPAFIIAQIFALIALLRRERFDAVHCHWLVPQGFALAVASLFVRIPSTLLTCHGADAFTLNSGPMRAIKRWILGRVDGVTVVSREIGRQIRGNLTDDPAHIPMGVDVQRFAVTEHRKRAGGPSILFIGRLAEKKGLDRLLRCMADPRIAARKARLRVIGDGPLRGCLERLAGDLGIGERVEFAGALTHEELGAEMARASLFCAPFVVAADGDREGTPTVLMEAAAAGMPIVTTDVGGCRDIVTPRRSGWLVEPGNDAALIDAMVEALDDPQTAGRMAAHARKKAQDYSWSRIADRYADALVKVQEQQPDPDHRKSIAGSIRALLASPAGRSIGVAASALSLAAFLALLIPAFSTVETDKLLRDHWVAIAGALALYLLGYLPMVGAWTILAEATGCRSHRRELVRIFLVSQVAKYLPGNVGQFIGRAYAGRRLGLRVASLTKAMALEVGGVFVASAILAVAALALGLVSHAEGAGLGWTTSLALGLTAGAALFGSAMIFRGDGKRSLLRPCLIAVSCYVAVLVMTASANVLLVAGNSDQWSLSIALAVAGAFLVSWLAGFITPGAPAGLGVRELAFCALLSGTVPSTALILSAAAFRLVTTAGDGIAWVGGMMLRRPADRLTISGLAA